MDFERISATHAISKNSSSVTACAVPPSPTGEGSESATSVGGQRRTPCGATPHPLHFVQHLPLKGKAIMPSPSVPPVPFRLTLVCYRLRLLGSANSCAALLAAPKQSLIVLKRLPHRRRLLWVRSCCNIAVCVLFAVWKVRGADGGRQGYSAPPTGVLGILSVGRCLGAAVCCGQSGSTHRA